jgi:hypothetical protein
MRKDSPHTQWVYDVDYPEECVEQVWLVDEEFYKDHYKNVDWVWFVDASKLDNPYIKKVYVAGYDSWYAQQYVQDSWPNLPRKLHRR